MYGKIGVVGSNVIERSLRHIGRRERIACQTTAAGAAAIGADGIVREAVVVDAIVVDAVLRMAARAAHTLAEVSAGCIKKQHYAV